MLIFMLSHNAVYFEGGEAQLERLTLNAFSSSEICCNIFARDTFSSCSLIENVYMAGVLRVRACVRVVFVFVFVDTRLIDCGDLKTKVRVSFIV